MTLAMIVEENIRARAEGIEKLINVYMPVRQAWQEAERVMPPPKRAETGETKAAYAPDASGDGVFRAGWNG
ncbi:MAG: hypothetical protein ACRD3S_09000 [Terracidiphilus sp.]